MSDEERAIELLKLCRRFIAEQHIYCAETVYQSDRVIENAYEFIEDVCDIAGYFPSDDEDET